MNLENLNLVELNAQEVQEVVGGEVNWFAVGVLAFFGILALLGYETTLS